MAQPTTESYRPESGHLPITAPQWLTAGRFAALLALLIFAAFPQVLLGLQTFVVRDYGFFAYPSAYFQRECFWKGELPFWNPYNNCGLPFLAQWNVMALYPPALIYLVLPLTWSLSFFCLLHMFSAGMGMYFLARRWTGSSLGASMAGLIFAFNGLSLNLLMWPSHMATLSWMPWVVLAVQHAWTRGGRALVPAVLAGALQMLAGGPETILLTWLFLATVWLVERIGGGFRAGDASQNRAGRTAVRFLAVIVLVAGVAAAQLLPFMDLVAHSERGSGYADMRWSMPKSGLASFLVPMLYGQVSNVGVFFQNDQGWTSSYYLGVGAILLALLAVITVRDRRLWLLAGLTAAALALALGGHSFVYLALRSVFPQISMITYPVKFVLLAVFCVPLLAAFALARVEAGSAAAEKTCTRVTIIVGGFLLICILAILALAWQFPHPTDDVKLTLRNGLVRAVFLAVTVCLLLGLQRGARQGPWRMLPVLLLAVTWLDVLTHAPSQNPVVPPNVYAPGLARKELAMKPLPALGGSRAMISPAAESKFMHFTSGSASDNFLVNRLAYFADCNVLDAVPKVNGFFSLYPRAIGDLVTTLYAQTNADYPRLEDFMGVSQKTAPGQFFEWTNRDTYMPFVTAGQKPVYVDGTNALLSLFESGFDPRSAVVLPTEAKAFVTVTNIADSRIAPRISPTLVAVETEAAHPILVVIAQTYYHCWKASVDGQPAKLLQANYAFQAVEVPAGSHKVTVAYEDHAFRLGAIISTISLLACVLIWWAGKKNRAEPITGTRDA